MRFGFVIFGIFFPGHTQHIICQNAHCLKSPNTVQSRLENCGVKLILQKFTH